MFNVLTVSGVGKYLKRRLGRITDADFAENHWFMPEDDPGEVKL